MANNIISSYQIAEKSILDINGKQTYLGSTFLVSTNLIAGISASTETPILYLNNPSTNAATIAPSGSDNPSKSTSIFQYVRKMYLDTIGPAGVFRFYSQPTGISNGSPLTPLSLRPGLQKTSLMTATLSPTVSNKGTYFATLVSSLVEVDSSVIFILDPGYSLLVTCEISDTANVGAELVWYEI